MSCIFCCFNKTDKKASAATVIKSSAVAPENSERAQAREARSLNSRRPRRLHPEDANNQFENLPPRPRRRVQKEPSPEKVKFEQRVKVKTYIKSDLLVKDFPPEEKELRRIYKYSCPLCFRYFNKMLDCDACKNYVCFECVEGLIEKINGNPNRDRCPHCNHEKATFSEVDPEAAVKRYTDTPYGTFQSSVTAGGFFRNSRMMGGSNSRGFGASRAPVRRFEALAVSNFERLKN